MHFIRNHTFCNSSLDLLADSLLTNKNGNSLNSCELVTKLRLKEVVHSPTPQEYLCQETWTPEGTRKKWEYTVGKVTYKTGEGVLIWQFEGAGYYCPCAGRRMLGSHFWNQIVSGDAGQKKNSGRGFDFGTTKPFHSKDDSKHMQFIR
jgi:hypothetical protein